MERTRISDWKQVGSTEYQMEDGTLVGVRQLTDYCKYYDVPATLLRVDNKFSTNTFQQIASKTTSEVEFLRNGEKVQFLDPKSKYLSDERFELLVEQTKRHTGIEPTIKKSGLDVVAEFTSPLVHEDEFLGDAFSKSFRLERLPQGGLDLATTILRLVCTNGMTLPDKQYHTLSRKAEMPAELMTSFYDSVSNLNVGNYFKSLFTNNGEQIQASVSDYMGMATTLSQINIDGDPEIFFPLTGIQDFYKAQGIDITSISKPLLSRLPSGLLYYQCFNILTHAAKIGRAHV